MKNTITFLMVLLVFNTFSQVKKTVANEPKIELKKINAGGEIIVQTVGNESEISNFEIPFDVIEQVPLFPACENVAITAQRDCFTEHMTLHIKANLEIPIEIEEETTSVRAFALFQIDKVGIVKNITVRIRNATNYAVYEAEVIRVIGKLPRFTPGIQRGKAVNTNYVIPIIFSNN